MGDIEAPLTAATLPYLSETVTPISPNVKAFFEQFHKIFFVPISRFPQNITIWTNWHSFSLNKLPLIEKKNHQNLNLAIRKVSKEAETLEIMRIHERTLAKPRQVSMRQIIKHIINAKVERDK